MLRSTASTTPQIRYGDDARRTTSPLLDMGPPNWDEYRFSYCQIRRAKDPEGLHETGHEPVTDVMSGMSFIPAPPESCPDRACAAAGRSVVPRGRPHGRQ